jgi:hypothetical protein
MSPSLICSLTHSLVDCNGAFLFSGCLCRLLFVVVLGLCYNPNYITGLFFLSNNLVQSSCEVPICSCATGLKRRWSWLVLLPPTLHLPYVPWILQVHSIFFLNPSARENEGERGAKAPKLNHIGSQAAPMEPPEFVVHRPDLATKMIISPRIVMRYSTRLDPECIYFRLPSAVARTDPWSHGWSPRYGLAPTRVHPPPTHRRVCGSIHASCTSPPLPLVTFWQRVPNSNKIQNRYNGLFSQWQDLFPSQRLILWGSLLGL